jgi:hypothetical protein
MGEESGYFLGASVFGFWFMGVVIAIVVAVITTLVIVSGAPAPFREHCDDDVPYIVYY